MKRALVFIILLVIFENLFADCNRVFLTGPPSDHLAHIHTSRSNIDDFSAEDVRSWVKTAVEERIGARENIELQNKKLQLKFALTKTKLDEGEKLELITALELLNDKYIGRQFKNNNIQILHPHPWEYLDERFLGSDLRKFTNDGMHVRQFFELDIELQCCIVEVTYGHTFEEILAKKKNQLRRMVNKNGRTNFINPDGKKVILYAPNMREDVKMIEELDVIVSRSKNDLIRKIRSIIKAKH